MGGDHLLDRFVAWASGRDDVRAALLIGSRARSERPADEWSDTDVLLLAADPDALIEDAAWPTELGDVAITFVEHAERLRLDYPAAEEDVARRIVRQTLEPGYADAPE